MCHLGRQGLLCTARKGEGRVLPQVRGVWLIPGLWLGLCNLSFPICRMGMGLFRTSDFAMCSVVWELYLLNTFFFYTDSILNYDLLKNTHYYLIKWKIQPTYHGAVNVS